MTMEWCGLPGFSLLAEVSDAEPLCEKFAHPLPMCEASSMHARGYGRSAGKEVVHSGGL